MLDAEMAAFVTETEQFYPANVAQRSVAEQRATYNRMAAHFRAPRPDGLQVRDSSVPGPDGAVPVRHYAPVGGGGGARVVYFHGGGFVLGGLESHDDTCAQMAVRTGREVVAVDYRLAPEHPHPAAYEDGLAAARAVGAQGPIVLAGDSVGGGLVGGVALALRREPVQALGQVLIYPSLGGEALDLPGYREKAVMPLLSSEDLRVYQALRSGGTPPWSDPTFAPLSAPDVSGVAPAAAFAVEFDPLCDDGAAWVDRLQAAGVSAASEIASGLCHGCLRARTRSARASAFFDRICQAVADFAQM